MIALELKICDFKFPCFYSNLLTMTDNILIIDCNE